MTTEPSLNIEELRRVAEVVRARYTPVPVPPCVVCGKPLNVARAGGGIVAYACDAAPMADGDHYARSSFETRAGDPDVLSLLNYISSVEAERDEAIALDEPLIERLAYEASVWAKDPNHNIGADQPSLVFARRFAFLLNQATRRQTR